jgi:enamine deaminase RidA (YjgF/YER057c/UK114 family)
MRIDRLEHVQLAMPPGGESQARAFYSGVLGIPEIAKPPTLAKRGGCWLQFRDVFQFVGMHLRAANLRFEHIVDLTTYHVDLRKHLVDFVRVKDEFIHEPFPTWTAVGISELITPGALVEARIIAQSD